MKIFIMSLHARAALIMMACIAILMTLGGGSSPAQESDSSAYFERDITVVANKDYEIAGLYEVILGKHWRDVWKTPFRVGVIDLNKFGGGIKAYKKGGGLQTKSIHFRNEEGKRYKFRTIDKDPRQVLPPDLRNSILADAFKDQISTSHPAAGLIASRMLDEVGVLNAKPFITVLPDDEALGEFRTEFEGLLGTMEETPTGSKDGRRGFADAEKIIDTYELYEKLEKDNDNRVDTKEFLKARLMDLLMGDWDRHYDQWLWAGYEEDGMTIYKPIPRDRDQAFSLYDGLLPMVAGRAITQIEGYGENYPPIYDLTFNGRYLDRRILPAVNYSDYDSLATFIREKITDEVIDDALNQMPPEWRNIGSNDLKKMIIARREKLNEAAEDFYELINEVADVYGSDKNEEFNIFCSGDFMTVTVYKIKKDGSRDGPPLYSRHFDATVTDEIRIYMNEGRDIVSVSGDDTEGGMYYSYFPTDVKLIEGDGKKIISNKDLAFIDITKDVRSKTNPQKRYEPVVEDRGYDWRHYPILNYNTDDGLILGVTNELFHYSYNAVPFDYRLGTSFQYAFGSKGFSLDLQGEFYSVIKGVRIQSELLITQLGITHFYGLGNETPYDEQKEKDGFYKVNQNLLKLSVLFEKKITKKTSLAVIPFIKGSRVNQEPDTYLFQNPDIYGIQRLNFIGLDGRISFDTRNNEYYPQRGFYVNVYGNYTPNLMKNNYGFGKAGIDARAYYSRDTTRGVVFALRAAGGKVWGTHPFYESLFLGGVNSFKGYRRERFAGDGLVLGQAEIRIPVTTINILVPGLIGISGFGGVGRVFLEGEESKKWHAAYGLTAWISYLNRLYNFELTVAKSYEGLSFAVGTAYFL